MKKFLFYNIIFSCLVIAFLLPIELLTRNIPNSYKEKTSWMEKNSKDTETLILGNSHTYMGIDPACFDHPAFNLANVSQPYQYDYILLEKYIDRMPALKNLILPVSYHSLVFNLANDGEWWREINYKLYMDCNVHSSFSKYNFEIMNPKNCMTRCRMYYLQKQDLIQMTPLGLSTTYTGKDKEEGWDNGKERAIVHTKQTRDSETYQENLFYLNKIAALTNEHSINLVLVTLPVTDSYVNAADGKQIVLNKNEISRLMDNYAHIYYIDLWRMEGLTEDDFANGDHMNDSGAIKVAKKIEKEMKKRNDI